MQGNFDEVRSRRVPRLSTRPDLRPPGTDLRLLSAFVAQLKTHHTKIQTAYDSLASQYHDLTNEKNDMERFYKEQVETWRGDLELKHAQFEEARAQIMQPRELDTLRKQLMEEIETPARAKLHAYEAEIEEQTERTRKPCATWRRCARRTTSRWRVCLKTTSTSAWNTRSARP